jgi:uncharacterized alkaline shock family protein YloU
MIVSLSASSVKGVADMSAISRPPGRVRHKANMGSAPGVILQVHNGTIASDVYIVADRETNLTTLGQTVQQKVREALDLMVGMAAEQVNVYIEDVKDA